jgi:prepilin peptidase CpaA
LLGFAVGIGCLVIPFACGFVGAGDAKLLGAVGAFVGPQLALRAFVAGTCIGFPLALLAVVQARIAGAARPAALPYAVPLALGTLVALGLEWAGIDVP